MSIFKKAQEKAAQLKAQAEEAFKANGGEQIVAAAVADAKAAVGQAVSDVKKAAEQAKDALKKGPK